MIISLTGIILLTPVFMPEQNGNFDEKKWLLALSFALILLTFIYLRYVKHNI